MRVLKHIILIFLPIFITFFYSEIIVAKKIKQTHKIDIENSRKSSASGKHTSGKIKKALYVSTDTLLKDSIHFSGYDKPINATKESFLVINNSRHNIKKVGIRLTYLDLNDRMLHSRETEAECDVPSGETRLLSIPTWDRLHTFFYYSGPEPHRVATPYKIAITLLYIVP